MASWHYSEPLVTNAVSCDECLGNLVMSDNQPAEVTLYTRHGTKFCQHFCKVCPNRWCRKKFMYGYTIKNSEKVYDILNHKTENLITSNAVRVKSRLCDTQTWYYHTDVILSHRRDTMYHAEVILCITQTWYFIFDIHYNNFLTLI